MAFPDRVGSLRRLDTRGTLLLSEFKHPGRNIDQVENSARDSEALVGLDLRACAALGCRWLVGVFPETADHCKSRTSGRGSRGLCCCGRDAAWGRRGYRRYVPVLEGSFPIRTCRVPGGIPRQTGIRVRSAQTSWGGRAGSRRTAVQVPAEGLPARAATVRSRTVIRSRPPACRQLAGCDGQTDPDSHLRTAELGGRPFDFRITAGRGLAVFR